MAKSRAAKQKVTFTYLGPGAKAVLLAGTFTSWEQAPLAMNKLRDGTWSKVVSLPEGSHEYRFIVDGQWHDDPQCPDRRPNQFGTENCVRVVKGTGA